MLINRCNSFIFCLLLLLLITGLSNAQSPIIYVDSENGSDQNTGLSITNIPIGTGPKATIKAGLLALTDQGTLIIMAGSYSGVDGAGGAIDINTVTYPEIKTGLTIQLYRSSLQNEIKITSGDFRFNLPGGKVNITSNIGNEYINIASGNVFLDNGLISFTRSDIFRLRDNATITRTNGLFEKVPLFAENTNVVYAASGITGAMITGNEMPDFVNNLSVYTPIILENTKTVSGCLLINGGGIELDGHTLITLGDITISSHHFFEASTPSELRISGNTDSKFDLNELKTPPAGLKIKINKSLKTNKVTLTGNSLDFSVNKSTLYFINGIIVTGSNYIKLYAPLNGGGQGFDRSGVTNMNVSHIVGYVRKELFNDGTIIGSSEPAVIFPVGSLTFYRPVTFTFNPILGIPAVPNTTLIVKHVDELPSGKLGLPIIDGVSTGVNISRYANFYWSIQSTPVDLSNSTEFDLELAAAGFSSFDNITNLRIIRRTGDAGSSDNYWGLQGGTSNLAYDNSIINLTPIIGLKNATGGLSSNGSVFTLGFGTGFYWQKIPDQTLMVGGSPGRIYLPDKLKTSGTTGIVVYNVSSLNPSVAKVNISHDTLIVTPVSQGNTSVTVTATDETGDFLSTIFSAAVNPIADWPICGKVTYENSSASVLSGVKITLTPGNYSAISDASGTYALSNVPDGKYTISASYAQPWVKESINATDALMAALYFLDPVSHPLSEIRIKAADVNNNGVVNNTDALLIIKRMTGLISSFDISDWIFTTNSFTINGAVTTNWDLKGILAGEINGSYNP